MNRSPIHDRGIFYAPLALLLQNHSKTIWKNWIANLHAENSFSDEERQVLKSVFEPVFQSLCTAGSYLAKNNLTGFYNEMMESWLLPNSCKLLLQPIHTGFILLEKSVTPLLVREKSEVAVNIMSSMHQISLQLLYMIDEITRNKISLPDSILTNSVSMAVSQLESLPIDKLYLIDTRDRQKKLVGVWEQTETGLEMAPNLKENCHLSNEPQLDGNILSFPVHHHVLLAVQTARPLTHDELNLLRRVVSLLSGIFELAKQNESLQDHIFKLELLRKLDEKVLRHSGPEGLFSMLKDCQYTLNFKRSAFFGYTPWIKGIEGVLGLNIDQQKIQSIREPLNKMIPFREAFLTKKPVHLTTSAPYIPELYVKWFELASLFIVPVVKENVVYGWFVLDQKGKEFTCSTETFELSELISSRIGMYLARSESGVCLDQTVHLTDRESDILQFLAEGHDNKSIGKSLNISEYTVRDYISKLMTKFQAKNRAQMVAAGFRRGLLK